MRKKNRVIKIKKIKKKKSRRVWREENEKQIQIIKNEEKSKGHRYFCSFSNALTRVTITVISSILLKTNKKGIGLVNAATVHPLYQEQEIRKKIRIMKI